MPRGQVSVRQFKFLGYFNFPELIYRVGAGKMVIIVDALVGDDRRSPEDDTEKSKGHCQLVPHEGFCFGMRAGRWLQR